MKFLSTLVALVGAAVATSDIVIVPFGNPHENKTINARSAELDPRWTCSLWDWNVDTNMKVGNGARDCVDYHIFDGKGKSNLLIGAKCTRMAGGDDSNYSMLDMDKCAANHNGQLAWAENGGAFGSCRNCVLQQERVYHLSLKCECDDGNGNWPTTTLDGFTPGYGGPMRNNGGNLACFGQTGKKNGDYGTTAPDLNCIA